VTVFILLIPLKAVDDDVDMLLAVARWLQLASAMLAGYGWLCSLAQSQYSMAMWPEK